MKIGIAIIYIFTAFIGSQGQTTFSCVGIPDGYVFNDPSAPANYFMCIKNALAPMKCVLGFGFCEGGNACTFGCGTTTTTSTTTTTTTTTPAPISCEDHPDGTLFPNSSYSSSYYICLNGIPIPGKCILSLCFDASIGACTNKC